MGKVRQVAVDSSGNEIEVLTIKQAAKFLGITKSELKLQLYKRRYIPYYKVVTKHGSKVTRIKKKDLEDFVLDNEMYKRVAERIRQARLEHSYIVTGLPQCDLAKKAKIKREHLNRIENNKCRIGIKTLEKIARVLDKPIEYFLD